MPNRCSAPGCKSNYDNEEQVPVFKMPLKPDELRHDWLRALHRDDIDELKNVYVCSKHFREGDIEYMHRIPNGDGTYREIPRKCLKLREGVVPSLLPGCPTYYSSHLSTKRSRLSLESKDDEHFSQAVSLSLKSEIEDNQKFLINIFQDLEDKLPLLSISKPWSHWYPNPHTLIFMRPSLNENNISVDAYISVEFDLSIRAYRRGEIFLLSQTSLSDTRQIEMLLDEISVSPQSTSETSKNHIQQVIDNIQDSASDDELYNCSEI